MFRRKRAGVGWGILVSALFSSLLLGQSHEGVLRGRVLDPSGAPVPAITVSLLGSGGIVRNAQTDERGRYVFSGLPVDTYTLRVHLKGFADVEQTGITVAPNKLVSVDAQLQLAREKQQVTVTGSATRLDVAAARNASALVLQGKDLKALSDDPEDLQAELEALAGPAAGPNGGQIFIDGFTGGQLPPKSDILEVHVNQDPFSAQYDKLGYGRIEITTKPGSSHFHGHLFADGSDSALNSRNPFVAHQPPYHLAYGEASLGGPLGKKASFYLYGLRRDMLDNAIVDAYVLDPALTQEPFSQALLQPKKRTYLGPRVDLRLSSKDVLALRYQYWHESMNNLGTGQFDLASQAYDSLSTEHSIQMSETHVASSRTVNQTLFRYMRDLENDNPVSTQPAVEVLGAFTGGGNTLGRERDTLNNYELQNMTMMSLGHHLLALGGRARDLDVVNSATTGFNGLFLFPSLAAYQVAEQALGHSAAVGQPACGVSGASQFTLTAGNPTARLNLFDIGLYAQDQWRARPNLSLTLGLRFEAQNHIPDHADWAPRVGLAWGIGGGTKTVLRAGAGVFYDRFQQVQLLQAEHLNGLNEAQYVVTAPDFFPNLPSLSALGAMPLGQALPTRYQIDPHLRAPYVIQAAAGLERKVTNHVTASVTYLNSHGVHQLLTSNINTPLPGTYDPQNPASGLHPFGEAGNIFQYESAGLFNQNQLITNFNARVGSRFSLFGYYTLSYADSNTGGPTAFVMNPYDLALDYGRAAFDVRHRVFVGGSAELPRGFSFSPLVIANSGLPFNITLGRDLLGTSVFNARPALAPLGDTGSAIMDTPLGAFNTLPAVGEPFIPPYYGAGPGQFTLNLKLSKTFTFGNKAGQRRKAEDSGWQTGHVKGLGGRGLSSGGSSGGGRESESRYRLELGIAARNVFNFVNLGPPVGNLTSPIFGRANSLAQSPFSSLSAPRRIDLWVRFAF